MLRSLLPLLFFFTHDPRESTRSIMRSLWKQLVATGSHQQQQRGTEQGGQGSSATGVAVMSGKALVDSQELQILRYLLQNVRSSRYGVVF